MISIVIDLRNTDPFPINRSKLILSKISSKQAHPVASRTEHMTTPTIKDDIRRKLEISRPLTHRFVFERFLSIYLVRRGAMRATFNNIIFSNYL